MKPLINEQNSIKKFFPVTLSTLRSKRGEGYIDAAVMTLAAVMVLVVCINIFSLLVQKQNLDYFAKELLNSAAVSGRISTEVNERYNELKAETGLAPVVTWTAVYFDSSDKKVQLADTISVKLSLSIKVQGTGEMVPIPITLTSGGSTLSERYWKTL